jgi:hypothetical protein
MISQKITTLDITSPILTPTATNGTATTPEHNGNEITEDNLSQLPASSVLLKQKSFSFLMSKQLIRRPTSSSTAVSSLSSSAITPDSVSSNSSYIPNGSVNGGGGGLFTRHNSTVSTLKHGNFIKTKTSLYNDLDN